MASPTIVSELGGLDSCFKYLFLNRNVLTSRPSHVLDFSSSEHVEIQQEHTRWNEHLILEINLMSDD
jgi:hypothetical protein